eukprot:Lithocolla_globosa_v1_NODE_7078_length_995_cov_9.565957.p2 type:complete len:146 gc:universal NODE_7078_length_995_cov_9.565957:316-753(+)
MSMLKELPTGQHLNPSSTTTSKRRFQRVPKFGLNAGILPGTFVSVCISSIWWLVLQVFSLVGIAVVIIVKLELLMQPLQGEILGWLWSTSSLEPLFPLFSGIVPSILPSKVTVLSCTWFFSCVMVGTLASAFFWPLASLVQVVLV